MATAHSDRGRFHTPSTTITFLSTRCRAAGGTVLPPGPGDTNDIGSGDLLPLPNCTCSDPSESMQLVTVQVAQCPADPGPTAITCGQLHSNNTVSGGTKWKPSRSGACILNNIVVLVLVSLTPACGLDRHTPRSKVHNGRLLSGQLINSSSIQGAVYDQWNDDCQSTARGGWSRPQTDSHRHVQPWRLAQLRVCFDAMEVKSSGHRQRSVQQFFE